MNEFVCLEAARSIVINVVSVPDETGSLGVTVFTALFPTIVGVQAANKWLNEAKKSICGKMVRLTHSVGQLWAPEEFCKV